MIFNATSNQVINSLIFRQQDSVIPLRCRFSRLPLLLRSLDLGPASLDGMIVETGMSSHQWRDAGDRGLGCTAASRLDLRVDADVEEGMPTVTSASAFALNLSPNTYFFPIFTIVSMAVVSNFLGANWSRPFGNTVRLQGPCMQFELYICYSSSYTIHSLKYFLYRCNLLYLLYIV
jgi:hypothetical protein